MNGRIENRLKARPYRTLLLGVFWLLGFSYYFRLDAMFGPQEPSRLVFIPFVAFAGGLAIQRFLLPAPRPSARGKSLQLRAAVFFGALLLLLGLHILFVEHEPHWTRAVVVSWPQPPENCDCRDLATKQDGPCFDAATKASRCIECLGGPSNQEDIEKCWGKGRILLVRSTLALLYLMFAGSCGAWFGLFLLPEPPIRVFVSYRTADSGGLVEGPVADALQAAFGRTHVFIADRLIAGGAKWSLEIKEYGETCDAFVIVVGPAWYTELARRAGGADGNEVDWVKVEVETALRRSGCCLVPLVFGGAEAPQQKNLPPELSKLAETQAVVLARDAVATEDFEVLDKQAFDRAMEDVIVAIKTAVKRQRG